MEVTWEEGRWLLIGKNLILTKLLVGVQIVGVMCSNALTGAFMALAYFGKLENSHHLQVYTDYPDNLNQQAGDGHLSSKYSS